MFSLVPFDRVSSLNRSSRQVRIAFDPRFNKLSSKLQSYRALFSNAVHCSEELVPLMVDVWPSQPTCCTQSWFNGIVHKDCSQTHFCPLMMMQERYLIRSWLYFKIFSNDEAVRLAKVVAGGVSNHTLRKFAKILPSRGHNESTISLKNIDGRLQDLVMYHEWDDHLPIGPFMRGTIHHRILFTPIIFTCGSCTMHNCLEICTTSTHRCPQTNRDIRLLLLDRRKKEREFYLITSSIYWHRKAHRTSRCWSPALTQTFLRSSVILVRQVEIRSAQMAVKTVKLQQDFGLYETRDYLISEISQGRFLTNWNVDDRKHKMSLAIKTDFSRKPGRGCRLFCCSDVYKP